MSNSIVPQWTWRMPQVHALSTSRRGGSSPAPYDDGAGGPGLNLGAHVGDDPARVAANRARLRAQLPAEPGWLAQVHGAHVVDAAQLAGMPEADASFSTRPGVVCAVLTADCLPVLLADRAGRVVGASHAGWRGLAGGVLQNTVERMRAAGAEDMQAWLGPAIGPRRFEVGPEVRAAFLAIDPGAGEAFRPKADNKYLADIYQLARLALRGCGVTAVSGGERCTVSEADYFYSYRRDGVTGRMASLIWISG